MSLQSRVAIMTFIRKRDESKDSEEKPNAEKKCFKQKEDILKLSIKTVGFEDSTQFFIQSGKERLKTVARAANLFYSSRHMSASLALGTM